MNDVVLTPSLESADPANRRLSFAFAKRHGVLVNRIVNGVAECIYRESASPQALAEVRRYLRRRSSSSVSPRATFDELLRRSYEAGSDAMQAVGGPGRQRRTWRTWRRSCPSRPICSTATMMRRSSASSTRC